MLYIQEIIRLSILHWLQCWECTIWSDSESDSAIEKWSSSLSQVIIEYDQALMASSLGSQDALNYNLGVEESL